MKLASLTDWWIGARPLKPHDARVVVTGGSAGIGYAIADVFAERGCTIILCARNPERLARAQAVLAAAHPDVAIQTIAADLATDDGIETLRAKLASDTEHNVDVLVHAAGVGLSGPILEQAPADAERLQRLNITAVTELTRVVLPGMLAKRSGGVITLASLGGLVPGPYQADYYASKAHIISWMEALAWEVRRQGVRVTCVAPGPVETRFHARMGAEGALYRRLMPSLDAKRVARAAVTGFDLGRTLVIPGALFTSAALLSRIVPRKAQAALLGGFLKNRGQSPDA
ncbi:MAG: SDR family oxidoreductase [Pseudomonadota bacterium]